MTTVLDAIRARVLTARYYNKGQRLAVEAFAKFEAEHNLTEHDASDTLRHMDDIERLLGADIPLLLAVAEAAMNIYVLQMERNDIQERINDMYNEGDAPTRTFAHKLEMADDAILDACRVLCSALAPLLEEAD